MNFTRKLLTREGFLSLVTLSFGGIAGIAVGIPIIGYMISPLINQPKNVFRDVRDATTGKIVDLSSIPVGLTSKVVYDTGYILPWSGQTSKSGAWLRRTGQDSFIAYAIYCTHLGCPVQWLGEAKIFLCPCHGSVFNADGTVAGGPAPQPLFTYPVRVKNGRVQIQTEALPVV